jgi:RNase P subunit RPR2
MKGLTFVLGAANNFGNFNMPIYHIEFSDRETIVDKMKVIADESGISVEQLIKRFICDGMRPAHSNKPIIPGQTLDDFFVKNGVLKAITPD